MRELDISSLEVVHQPIQSQKHIGKYFEYFDGEVHKVVDYYKSFVVD